MCVEGHVAIMEEQQPVENATAEEDNQNYDCGNPVSLGFSLVIRQIHSSIPQMYDHR
jgi:hypothetical protein